MSWIYSFKDGLSALRKSRHSSILPIITVSFSLFFLGVFAFAIVKGTLLVRYLKSHLTMELFLRDGIGEDTLSEIQSQLIHYPEIERLTYISKEQALEEFNKEFESDIGSVLGENPLPPSFRVLLKPEYQAEDLIEEVKLRIENISGIDEVVYRFDLQNLIQRYLKIATLFVLVMGGILVFVSVILISNTVKLSILNRKTTIEIMSLVGATQSFIRRPFIIEGALQGMFGAIMAILGILILIKILRVLFPQLTFDITILFLAISAWGILFGSLGSWLAIRRTLAR